MAEPIEMPFGVRILVGSGHHVLDEGPDPPWEWAILGKRGCHSNVEGLSAVNCAKTAGLNRSTSVWAVDLGGPKEAQVQSYLSDGINVPSWEGTLASLGEYY